MTEKEKFEIKKEIIEELLAYSKEPHFFKMQVRDTMNHMSNEIEKIICGFTHIKNYLDNTYSKMTCTSVFCLEERLKNIKETLEFLKEDETDNRN